MVGAARSLQYFQSVHKGCITRIRREVGGDFQKLCSSSLPVCMIIGVITIV